MTLDTKMSIGQDSPSIQPLQHKVSTHIELITELFVTRLHYTNQLIPSVIQPYTTHAGSPLHIEQPLEKAYTHLLRFIYKTF